MQDTHPNHNPPASPRLALFVVVLATTSLAQAFVSGSSGADGALNPSANVQITLPENGVLNYTDVNIPAGVTVTFRKNAVNTPVYLLVSGNITIAGSIDVSGGTAAATGTAGGGNTSDDGNPGQGGPGGYDGGRGGRNDVQLRSDVIVGGPGMGPGGGPAGVSSANRSCPNLGTHGSNAVYLGMAYGAFGTGGAYSADARVAYGVFCTGTYPTGWPMGKAYGSDRLQPLLGGSGGGGGLGGITYPGSGGGGGGGAILLAASGAIQVAGTGKILALGGDGGAMPSTSYAGFGSNSVGYQGAGGSGGAIRLVANTITMAGTLNADGGCIVSSSGVARSSCGADGGNARHGGQSGRIRLEAPDPRNLIVTGNSIPAFSANPPGPVLTSGSDTPSLSFATVGGVAVPANPGGSGDVYATSDPTTGNVTVVLETYNLPTNTQVALRVVPVYGSPTDVAAVSTVADPGNPLRRTATITTAMPSGFVQLQATATYTVAVAGHPGLSRFAANEPVDRVEISVPLGGEPVARLVTASGKRFEVPYQALRAAGFPG